MVGDVMETENTFMELLPASKIVGVFKVLFKDTAQGNDA